MSTTWRFSIHTHCVMTTTVELIDIYISSHSYLISCMVRRAETVCRSIFHVQETVLEPESPCRAFDVSKAFTLRNCNFLPFDRLFPLPPLQCLVTIIRLPGSMGWTVLDSISREATQYSSPRVGLVPCLGLYPKEVKSLPWRDVCASLSMAAYFTTAKTSKPLKCLPVDIMPADEEICLLTKKLVCERF